MVETAGRQFLAAEGSSAAAQGTSAAAQGTSAAALEPRSGSGRVGPSGQAGPDFGSGRTRKIK